MIVSLPVPVSGGRSFKRRNNDSAPGFGLTMYQPLRDFYKRNGRVL